ncbi:MAG: HAD family hydrolase [Candidatus Diapherotrites archaeon]|nr:HAD family hydrolase [Candidatus Diapherotrites archaeon]
MIETIIFDWNGVLMNDIECIFCATNDRLEMQGHARISRKKFAELYEMPWTNFYKKLGVPVNIEEEYTAWETLYPKYCKKNRLFPKAKETLQKLKQQKIRIIIFSSHNQSLLEEEVKEFGISSYIDVISGSHADKKEKILELVKKNGIKKEAAIYVGDTCHDIETARIVGIRSIGVLGGVDSKEKLEKAKPDFIIKGIGKLPKIIEKLDSENK